MLPRILVAAAVLAAVAACAPRTPGAAPSASGKPMYVPIPAEEVARVRDPHLHDGKPLCQRCHAVTGELAGDPIVLCKKCHDFGMHNHPVNVVQKVATDLPLMAGNKVACHTCHDPHQKKNKLRKPFTPLCTTCHKGH